MICFSPVSDYPGGYTANCDDKLVDYSDMHILDFLPSLKTLSIIAVKAYRLNYTDLPSKLK